MDTINSDTYEDDFELAICKGKLELTDNAPMLDVLDELYKVFPYESIALDDSPNRITVEIDAWEWNENCIDEFLHFITPYIIVGDIEICSEGFYIWRYVYSELKFWLVQRGKVFYQEGGRPIITDEIALELCGGVDYDD